MAIGREHMVDASEYHREAGTVDSLLVPTIFSQVSRRRAYTDCLCPASFLVSSARILSGVIIFVPIPDHFGLALQL